MSRILVGEDEPAIADAIEYVLSTEGMTVVRAATLQAARYHLSTTDLVVLDVSLPDGSSFDFCRELRKNSAVPVIFLTSRVSEVDCVVGLELGARGYQDCILAVRQSDWCQNLTVTSPTRHFHFVRSPEKKA